MSNDEKRDVVPLAWAPRQHFRAAYENRELRQAVWYYFAHLSSYLLPLLTFGYLARILGPAEWGTLAVFHSLGLYTSQIVEYGFNFTAARDVARGRDDVRVRASSVADVHASKILLSCLLIVAAAVFYQLLPPLMRNPLLFCLAIAYGLSQGLTLVWYFQGAGRLGELAAIDAVTRSAAAIATVVTVRAPADGWWMIALNTLGCLATTTIGLWIISRDTPLGLSGFRAAVATLRTGFPLFLFRGASSLYGAANGFVLGLFSTQLSVGYYAGAERVYKGFTALLHPLMQLLYARVNHAMGTTDGFDGQSGQVARKSALMMAGAGAVLGLACAVTSRAVVSILLGPGFELAVPVLRVFGLILFMEAIGIALGIQWMLPLGLDRQLTVITLAASAMNLLLAWWLAGPFGELGMALAVLASHTTFAAGCFAYLRWRGLDPLRRQGGE